ncbi:PTS sugar transporter subunit IIC [Gardnerella vaginalis]|nr:PTS sugar transporter subunit IIC [Gardnerella vaginalis]CQB85944.1 PTS system oligo-beta-mannoside-specific EIIC component [Chlamydia trachomatis]AEF31915.1 putative PTS system, cellobiose-specific IIC component [Gardnerella vaginalis HMP9231]KOS09555.1 PTS cellobiose transporter subunit IIC [Gardnerella vaginalis]MDK8327840.1 PTS sugar transporter subunit IIC [Gardnerella vaginalis]NSX28946.1 PTS sugar transporter subunit IIC [Gardnerella vaginalis]
MARNTMMDFLSNKLAPFGEKVAAQRHLKALREGVLMAMPLVLIGSIFTLIGSFPIEAWTKWLHTHGELDALLSTMANNSFGLIGLATAFGISYRLAESYKTDGPSAGVLAIGAFLLVTPPIASKEGANGIPYGLIGGKGLFTAIVIAFITAEIYRQFIQRKFTIKMPKSVPEAVGHSFAALVPGTVIIVLFAIVTKVLQVTGIGSLNNLLAIIVGTPLALIGATLPGTFVAVLLNSVFWFCGVNGGQVVGSVMNPIWLQQADANRIALQAGHALPNIITAPFMDLFVYMGGGGATIGLALCLLFFSRSREYKTLGRISGIPALFNINTAILFSFPTVLNPIMIFPFIFTPIINAVVTYGAMATGLVPYTTGVALPWTTPPIIGGFLATGSWQGAILQALLVVLSFIIYFPFFKAADAAHSKAEKDLMDSKNSATSKED